VYFRITISFYISTKRQNLEIITTGKHDKFYHEYDYYKWYFFIKIQFRLHTYFHNDNRLLIFRNEKHPLYGITTECYDWFARYVPMLQYFVFVSGIKFCSNHWLMEFIFLIDLNNSKCQNNKIWCQFHITLIRVSVWLKT